MKGYLSLKKGLRMEEVYDVRGFDILEDIEDIKRACIFCSEETLESAIKIYLHVREFGGEEV